MSSPQQVQRRDSDTAGKLRKIDELDLLPGVRNRPAPNARLDENSHYQQTVFLRSQSRNKQVETETKDYQLGAAGGAAGGCEQSQLKSWRLEAPGSSAQSP
jgi:hypothetical protein